MRILTTVALVLFATLIVGCSERIESSTQVENVLEVISDEASFDQPPEVVHMIAADYPEEARVQSVDGLVRVLMTIDATGEIREVSVLDEDAPELLRAAALAAAREWRFRPAQLEGTPVTAKIVVPFRFDLD